MLFETILLLIIAAASVFLIGIPVYKLAKEVLPKKRKNPTVEAKERLEQARLELEAAKLNKEAEKLYEKMYAEALEDEDLKKEDRGKL